MENKIMFLTMEKIHSEKKNQDYYIVRYILNKKAVEEFVSKEVFEKLSIKKLEYLKEYTGIFNVGNTSRGMSVVLFDIK